MHGVVLAATHDRGINAQGQDVPRPLLDLAEEPLLTVLVRRLAAVSGLDVVHVVTNEAILPELEAWRATLPPTKGLKVSLLSDGTRTPEDRKGAVGDLIYAIRQARIDDDVLVVGGDNWFEYDLGKVVADSRGRTPAVVVSPVPGGCQTARFGMVAVDDAGRITAFEEKPAHTTLTLKSSCVLYLAQRDLAHLDRFEREHSTHCAPGVFLTWLVETGVPVHAVQLAASWYDVGDAKTGGVPGPDHLAIRGILRRLFDPRFSTWERHAARLLQWASSYRDVLDMLHDGGPNRRIVAALVLGHLSELLSDQGRREAIDGLLRLLADDAENDIAYGVRESDEDSVWYVSASAAEALVALGYAGTVTAVFDKATGAGIPVARRQNVCG